MAGAFAKLLSTHILSKFNAVIGDPNTHDAVGRPSTFRIKAKSPELNLIAREIGLDQAF